MKPSRQTFVDLGLLLVRLSLGLFFVLAGIGKLRGEFSSGFGSFYRGQFSLMKPSWLPEALAMGYGYALPWIEVLFGVLLMLGLLGSIAAIVLSLVLLSILIALVIAHGLMGQPSAGGLFHTNYVFLTAALLLAATGPGRFSLDRIMRKKKG